MGIKTTYTLAYICLTANLHEGDSVCVKTILNFNGSKRQPIGFWSPTSEEVG